MLFFLRFVFDMLKQDSLIKVFDARSRSLSFFLTLIVKRCSFIYVENLSDI